MHLRLAITILAALLASLTLAQQIGTLYSYRPPGQENVILVSVASPVQTGDAAIALLHYIVPLGQELRLGGTRIPVQSTSLYLRGVDGAGTLHVQRVSDVTVNLDLVFPLVDGAATVAVPKPYYPGDHIRFIVRYQAGVFTVEPLDDLEPFGQ